MRAYYYRYNGFFSKLIEKALVTQLEPENITSSDNSCPKVAEIEASVKKKKEGHFLLKLRRIRKLHRNGDYTLIHLIIPGIRMFEVGLLVHFDGLHGVSVTYFVIYYYCKF